MIFKNLLSNIVDPIFNTYHIWNCQCNPEKYIVQHAIATRIVPTLLLRYTGPPSLGLDPKDPTIWVENLLKAFCQFGTARTRSANSVVGIASLFQLRHARWHPFIYLPFCANLLNFSRIWPSMTFKVDLHYIDRLPHLQTVVITGDTQRQ